MDPTCRICDRCAAPDCGSVLNPKAPQYTNEAGENICPACYWKAVSA
jgi:hypothetical protein